MKHLDLNRGGGTSLYLYYNGSFYPVDKSLLTNGWDGKDILTRYKEYLQKSK